MLEGLTEVYKPPPQLQDCSLVICCGIKAMPALSGGIPPWTWTRGMFQFGSQQSLGQRWDDSWNLNGHVSVPAWPQRSAEEGTWHYSSMCCSSQYCQHEGWSNVGNSKEHCVKKWTIGRPGSVDMRHYLPKTVNWSAQKY